MKDDDVLAAFKYTRFNNYKKGLYCTLDEYESVETLGLRINCNRVVSALFNGQKCEAFVGMERADPRFVAAVNLAYALMPCERGEILGALPQVSELMNALSQPLSNSASEALAIGSLVLPAVEAALFVLKSKLPKKQNPQINQQISLPLRETFKKLIA